MGTGIEEAAFADIFFEEAAALGVGDLIGGAAVSSTMGAGLSAADWAIGSEWGGFSPGTGFIDVLGDAAGGELAGMTTTPSLGWAAEAGTIGDWGGLTGADQGLTWFDKASSAMSDLGSGVKSVAGALQTPMSLYSGYKALTLADEMKKRSALLGTKADPWGASGGRAAADAQLQELNKNPTAAMAADPRYAAMVQAAQRATAMHGQDSGAMAAAGAQAGGNWYTQRMAELSGLAGATTSPAAGVQAEMAGLTASNDLYSRGLASIGYGTQRLAGTTVPPEVQRWLQSQGIV